MESDLVFDVGLHKGEDAEFYLKKGFRVVGIEADPANCAIAQERLQPYVASGQLTLPNVAIATEAGPITFYRTSRHSVWGTSPEWAARNARMRGTSTELTVEGIEFGQLLERYGCPYYLKIDIEGADLLCLKGLLPFDARPAHISLESEKVYWSALEGEFARCSESSAIRVSRWLINGRFATSVRRSQLQKGRSSTTSSDQALAGCSGVRRRVIG